MKQNPTLEAARLFCFLLEELKRMGVTGNIVLFADAWKQRPESNRVGINAEVTIEMNGTLQQAFNYPDETAKAFLARFNEGVTRLGWWWDIGTERTLHFYPIAK